MNKNLRNLAKRTSNKDLPEVDGILVMLDYEKLRIRSMRCKREPQIEVEGVPIDDLDSIATSILAGVPIIFYGEDDFSAHNFSDHVIHRFFEVDDWCGFDVLSTEYLEPNKSLYFRLNDRLDSEAACYNVDEFFNSLNSVGDPNYCNIMSATEKPIAPEHFRSYWKHFDVDECFKIRTGIILPGPKLTLKELVEYHTYLGSKAQASLDFDKMQSGDSWSYYDSIYEVALQEVARAKKYQNEQKS